MNIIYEDNHLVAVNKRAGEIVQGDKTGDVCVVDEMKSFLKKRDNKPGNVYVGLPHRLDRPTSGVLLLTKTDKALTRVNKLIHDREFDKTYWAIVRNKPPKNSDRLVHWLQKNEKQNKSYASDVEKNGWQKAELAYEVIASSDNYYLLEIKLFTGRHHQIRVQLSEIGCPIRGDLKYGFDRSNRDGSISLHARALEFIHPIKNEKIKIVAPAPKENLWKILEGKVA
ncbi:MAG: RluA family pseudouridine synthase [Bacteroidales bacterium]|nr:RluA family pseudouridine synthase [Bacteroidales bacterium]